MALWAWVVLFFVVNVYFWSDNWHLRITKFYFVFVKDFYKLLIWWKFFTNEFDKYSPDIGFKGLALWWIEPNNVSFSFLFVLIVFFWLLILYLGFISTAFQAFFIVNNSLLKNIFWWWQNWDSIERVTSLMIDGSWSELTWI